VTLVGIATSDQKLAAESYARANPSEFPALFDQDEVAARTYGVSGLPTLVVIDKHGKLVAIRSGLVREGDLQSLVQAAIEGN
ncbi:MAG TPA: TlpA disulfide reductase family protein, partial [Polyangiaceae bacterium]|nr:TlpA disulfide reductase family protein [Polyangiaceae bacterium]